MYEGWKAPPWQPVQSARPDFRHRHRTQAACVWYRRKRTFFTGVALRKCSSGIRRLDGRGRCCTKTSCDTDEGGTRLAVDMYGITGMPDLLPPTGAMQPSPALDGQTGRNGPNNHLPPRGMVQRAPKLGQIGRSKRVVIDDEELDDIMNNNRRFPVPLDISRLA